MDQLLHRLPMPAALLLTLGLLYTLANGIWFFLGGAETDVVAPTRLDPRAAATAETRLSGRELAALELFGAASPEVVEPVQTDAPETRLQLELKGVFLAEPEADSSAIVAQRNQPGELFFTGDRLPGNAVLERVLEDRILIRRGGRLETLRFPESGASAGFVALDGDAPAPAPLLPTGASAEITPEPDPADPTGRLRLQRSAASQREALRATLEQYERALAEDPEGTLAELGVEPVDGGGYRVGSGAPGEALGRVGLKPGDVVLSVNGMPVGDIQRDRGALGNVLSEGVARLEIQRDQRRFFVTARLQ